MPSNRHVLHIFFENKPQALPVDVEKTRPLEILLMGLILNLSTI